MAIVGFRLIEKSLSQNSNSTPSSEYSGPSGQSLKKVNYVFECYFLGNSQHKNPFRKLREILKFSKNRTLKNLF